MLGNQWRQVYNSVNISFLIRLSADSCADREFHCTKDKLNREEKALRRYCFYSGRDKFKDGDDNCRNSSWVFIMAMRCRKFLAEAA